MADIQGSQQVLPDAQVPGYTPTVAAAYEAGIVGALNASLAHADLTALGKIYCGGKQTVGVSMRGTTASGTMVTRAVRYDSDDVIISVEEFTPTLYAVALLGTDYFADTWAVDTEGCAYMRLHHDAPSAGTMALWAGVY